MVGEKVIESGISSRADSTRLELVDQRSIGKISFGRELDKKAEDNQWNLNNSVGYNFEAKWGALITDEIGKFNLPDKEREDLFNRCALEATQIYKVVKGENWLQQLTEEELRELKDITKNGYKKDFYADSINSLLYTTLDSKVRLPRGSEKKLELVHRTIGYDTARRNIEEGLTTLTERIKGSEVEGSTVAIRSAKKADIVNQVDKIIEGSHKSRRSAREVFEIPKIPQEKRDLKMDEELSIVMPQILDNAQLMGNEAQTKLLVKLGITINKVDGSYTIASSERMTEAQTAMYMVLDQRILNEQMVKRDIKIQSMVQSGELTSLVQKEGIDLLVLNAFELDSARDCGRYFQEEIRREVLRARVDELVVVQESTPPSLQDLTDREIMRGAGHSLQEAYIMAEGIFKSMARMVDSVFTHKLKSGSFLHRIMGGISSKLDKMSESAKEVTLEVPRIVPPRERGDWRPKLSMPDLFAEYET